MIEIEVRADWHTTGGASATFNAESGSHRVDLPRPVLSTDDLQRPARPINLTAGVDLGMWR